MSRSVMGSILAAVAWTVTFGPALAEGRTLGRTFRDCPSCGDMIVIPPGQFLMGAEGGEPDRYEGPVRKITIGYAFAVAMTPVTTAQFRRFVEATHYQPSTGCYVPAEGTVHKVLGADWRGQGPDHRAADDEPVVCIDWDDAHAYAAWLAKVTGRPYRMLTEAEYEYVARAGSTTPYAWGEDGTRACEYANLADASIDPKVIAGRQPAACNDGFPGLAPVGSLRANAFGVKDMNGNAWSWVQDCYRMPYPDRPADGHAVEADGQCDRRSVRGASWATIVSRARTSFRGRDDPKLTSALFGVRVARDLTPEESR